MTDPQELKVIWVSVPQLEIVVYKRTLHLLGYTCYTSADIFTNDKHVAIWKDVLFQNIPLDISVFENYDACAQTLPVSFYLDMINQFPDAKFIIEDIPPKIWAGRYKRLINMMRIFSWIRLFPKTRRYLQLIQHIMYLVTKGITSRLFLETIYSDFKSTVIKEVPKNRLLVFNPNDGWQPLCEFLGQPIPDTSLPLKGDKSKDTNNFVKRIVLTTLKTSNTAFIIAIYFIVLISIFVYLIFFY